MSKNNDPLEQAAALISDGSAVDWSEHERLARDDDDRAALRQLKVVAGIAEFHERRLADETGQRTIDAAGSGPAGAIAFGRPSEPILGQWGHLGILEKVGEGSFGEVYRAWDGQLDREVALKLLRDREGGPPSLSARFLEEGRLLARVRHPNVATVHGAECHQNRVGVWMEFVRGRTLAAAVEEQGTLGASEAMLIALDLCRALSAVHRAGLVHGDIKAQNVMREEGGRIVLMDFGAGSRVQVQAPQDGTRAVGTPLYMAPEIFHGMPATIQSDIFSLGVLLYYLVSGTYPVEARNLRDFVEARHDTRPLSDVRPDLPPAFVQVVEHAISWDPANRFASPGQMERALTSALGLEDHGPETAPDVNATPTPGPAQRTRWHFVPVWARVGIAAAALAGAVLVLRPWIEGLRTPGSPGPGSGDSRVTEPNAPSPSSAAGSAGKAGQAMQETAQGLAAPEKRATVERLYRLARLHEAMGNYAEARTAFSQGVDLARSLAGPSDSSLADGLAGLGWAEQALGNFEDSRRHYVEALSYYEKGLGPGHQRVAATLVNLASVYESLGLPDQATPLLSRARAISSSASPQPSKVGPGTKEIEPSRTTALASLGAPSASAEIAYTVNATLHRRHGGGSDRLLPGSQVSPGDELFLEFTASEDLFVYVLNEDDQGETYLLFPMRGSALQNPIPGGKAHHLPGPPAAAAPDADRQLVWTVTSAGGREHVMVIASTERLTEFEEELQALSRPRAGGDIQYARLSDATVTRLRGIGGVAERPNVVSVLGPTRLFERASQLAGQAESARGVWIRQIDLENPSN